MAGVGCISYGLLLIYVARIGDKVEKVADQALEAEENESGLDDAQDLQRQCLQNNGLLIPAGEKPCPACGEPINDGQHPPVPKSGSGHS